ncbi:MAG: hypothetical protein Q8K60_09260 [Parachlamydiaceae bacterium]|nr:hypothetical protein [Parachlamydiaceae bacterium]
MALSISQKQNYMFIGFIIATALTSILIYHLTQQKWVLLSKAENNYYNKSYKQAIEFYNESIELGKTNPNVYLHLAESYIATGNFVEGIKNYRLYLEIYPHDSSVRLLLARALSWNHQIDEAEKEYQLMMEQSNEELETGS